jgi:hypothetical protein
MDYVTPGNWGRLKPIMQYEPSTTLYYYYLGSFKANYIIFRNVEILIFK